MSQTRHDAFAVQRILIPLDAAEHSLAALETAAELAALQDAELEGLFVEDINLLQLCEFPFAQEISLVGPAIRRLSRTEVERQLRILARRVHSELAKVAERFQVRWKFRVTRGGVPAEVLAAAENADLTILGKSGSTMFSYPKTGSTVRTIVARGQGLTLIMQRGVRFEARASVLFTGSALAEKALSIAVSLGRIKNLSLLVFILARNPEEEELLMDRAEELSQRQGLQVVFRTLSDSSESGLLRVLQSHGPGPVFLPCEAPGLCGEALQGLINMLRNPIFLVRAAQAGDQLDKRGSSQDS